MRMFKQERERIGLTQNELAERLGVSQQTISKYENGSREPDLENLIRMSKIFHVTTDYLLGLNDSASAYLLHEQESSYFRDEISLRIKNLMEEHNLNSESLASICNLTAEEMRLFWDYGYLPHIDVLMKLADYFHVSIDYLLCRSNCRLTVETPEEEKLLTVFKSLNTDSRLILLGDALKELRREQGLSYDSSFSLLSDSSKKKP